MANNINVYLDDLRPCPKGFLIARNINKAIYYLENYNVNVLSLDHDLGLDSGGNILPTGYDLVKYFCENNLYANKIYIHTDNSVGRSNMYETLKASQRRGFISENIKIYHYPFIGSLS